jgi:hypothetical protein
MSLLPLTTLHSISEQQDRREPQRDRRDARREARFKYIDKTTETKETQEDGRDIAIL